jgi:hypothetical protein
MIAQRAPCVGGRGVGPAGDGKDDATGARRRLAHGRERGRRRRRRRRRRHHRGIRLDFWLLATERAFDAL